MSSRSLPHGPLYRALKTAVDGHRAAHPSLPGAVPRKALVIVAWFVASWVSLVFLSQTWWQAALTAVSLGLSMAGIGFCVQHDGGHRAASSSQGVNALMALGLDLLGGSSYVWHWKHNVHHHTNPNLVGHDADIDIEPLVRLSPTQAWRPWHRAQHLYAWALYALLAVKWHFFDDFVNVATGRISGCPFPRPRGKDLLGFVAGKLVFATWAFGVPLLLHPPLAVLGGYVLASVVLSLTLAITFQAAHCVEEAEFPAPNAPAVEWAEHQLRTSVDFGGSSAVVRWYVGGLDHQTVHHLFPRVPHVELAGLAPVVREVCRAHGVAYRELPGFFAAVASHGRHLAALGRQPVSAPVSTAPAPA
ncbi:MAG: acyl-CoA desaturase [Myxococcaceae bacterium]|nr:acyl-CoA desaturase [Myxococcaceae bacterium]